MSVFERVAALALRHPGRTVRTPMAVELVTGPPGSGKSTLVRERFGAGDCVIDLDLVAGAFVPLDLLKHRVMPLAWAARDAAMLALASEPHDLRKAWVIACAPTRAERHRAAIPFADVRLTVLEVPPAECLRRIEADQRADGSCHECGGRSSLERARPSGIDWRALGETWWRDYKRPVADEGWSEVLLDNGAGYWTHSG